jgi:MFS family permease
VGYGILLGCLGAGAVFAAIILPWVKVRISFESIAIGSTVLFAIATLILAFLRQIPILFLGMVVGGFGWSALMASLISSAFSTTPAWVLARVLAMYLLVLSGASSIGSALWGAIANYWSLPHALGFSAMTLILSIPAGLRYPLQSPKAPG